MKDMNGWFNGKYYDTGNVYNHIFAINEIPELKKLISNYDELINDLKECENGCLELIEIGEHPEWHTYEMASASTRWEMMCILYKAGCLRVGCSGNYMHFEGTPETIKNLYNLAKIFAESHNMTAEFEPIKFTV